MRFAVPVWTTTRLGQLQAVLLQVSSSIHRYLHQTSHSLSSASPNSSPLSSPPLLRPSRSRSICTPARLASALPSSPLLHISPQPPPSSRSDRLALSSVSCFLSPLSSTPQSFPPSPSPSLTSRLPAPRSLPRGSTLFLLSSLLPLPRSSSPPPSPLPSPLASSLRACLPAAAHPRCSSLLTGSPPRTLPDCARSLHRP